MEENKKRVLISKTLAWISLILSLIPYLVFLIFIIDFYMPSDEGHYGWIYIYLYFYYACLPISVSSLILEIISNKINKNKLALISSYLNVIPLAFALLYVLFIILRLFFV